MMQRGIPAAGTVVEAFCRLGLRAATSAAGFARLGHLKSARDCRCILRRSILISKCSMSLQPRPKRSSAPADRRSPPGCDTLTNVGNIHDLENDSTYCASCGQVLIERDWYELGRYNLDEHGCCSFCDARLPGRFGAKPGKWG